MYIIINIIIILIINQNAPGWDLVPDVSARQNKNVCVLQSVREFPFLLIGFFWSVAPTLVAVRPSSVLGSHAASS